MTSKQQVPSETELATKIKESGWRQGSIFSPDQNLEIPFSFDIDHEVFVIVTQSCSVVSQNFTAYPKIEAMAARKLQSFFLRSFEATGKNQRKLHLEISEELLHCKALEFDINRRFFFDREKLSDLSLIGSIEQSKSLAGWLGRSYTRVALPDELVANLKKEFFPILKKILSKDFQGRSLYSYIDRIYIHWGKNEKTSSFILDFIFMCTSSDASDFLDELLLNKLELLTDPKNNIYIKDHRCGTMEELHYSDTIGYDRFSHWDNLTGLEEIYRLIDTQ